ncbi:hypothetical protein PBAL39_18584 [Pedobacter sp. BAL39]|uniref:TraB/GumN family protein n=1 Tax=Pedobacter sp. BAL39 TaxID=391596 RepID=UPI000155962B|nr:TraB/GumN family protein [Pedobacter sp. BAL39]EDM36909.1 hypothetical protein PBAL39_18584 [Pedobacter sp. BAL39]
MKYHLFAFVFALLTICAPSTYAQVKPIENSLLWEISGNGLSKPSYLFGTFHILCPDNFAIADNVKTALSKTDRITFEVNIADPEFIPSIQKAMMSPIPLSKRLSPQQFQALDSVLTVLKSPYTLKQMDNLSLQAVSSFLMQKILPCETPVSFEGELLKVAQEQHKPAAGLETVEFQMECLRNAFSDEHLYQQILKIEKMDADLKAMIAMYQQQNLNGIYSYVMKKETVETESEKWMMEVRNKNWVAAMPVMMEKESNLFAVGAGHLGGKYSLVTMLREKGYTVKPIYK